MEKLSPNKLLNIEKEQQNTNPLKQIEKLLTCPICLDRYKQPKLLQCQHTFCFSCLENYVESTGGRPQLKCPECRFEHLLPLDGIQSLQNNLTLLSFLEIHMEASEVNAEEMQAYIQRFNMERCRVCEEKAELEFCVHCERKCCSECRNSHLEMLKRDLSRLLGQVRRLSSRIKEASTGIGRGLENILANGEQTKKEITEYFNRYQRELKIKEENFIEQTDIFIQNEERLLRTLRDSLDVEWNNLQDACLWVDSVLNGQRLARDDELARFKLEFQQGLDYLRSFQPDSDELFAKKLRFSPGDDAAKLPTAIANFGELSVSLPQFANRYLPLEQQYLPRPFRMGFESDNFMKFQKRGENNNKLNYRGGENLEIKNSGRWRRHKELLEDETLNRSEGLTPPPLPWSFSNNSSNPNSNRSSPMPQTLQIDIIGGEISSSKIQQTNNNNLNIISPTLIEKEENINNNKTKTSTTQSTNNSPKHNINSSTTLDNSKTSPKQQQQLQQNKQSSGIPSLTTNNNKNNINSTTTTRGRLLMVTGPNRVVGNNEGIENNSQIQPGNNMKKINNNNNSTPIIQQNKKTTQKPPLPTTSRQLSNDETKNNENNNNRKNSLEKLENEQKKKNNENKKGGKLQCRSSSHGRPSSQTRRLSIEQGGQPIPVAFFPTKSTGEWSSEQLCGLLLSRSRSNPQLFSNNSGIAPKFISITQKEELIIENNKLRPSRIDDSINKKIKKEENFYKDLKPRPKLILGGRGALGLLNWPRGVCSISREIFEEEEEDDFGTILAVADSSNHRIQLFSSNDGFLIRSFGTFGKENGQFDGCCSVCVHNERKELFVSDRYNHRVQVFDLKGRFLRKFGIRGSGCSQFQHCWGIAIDEYLGVVYIADKDNHRIQMFNEDGTFISNFGSMGDGQKQLNHPLYLTFDSNNRLLYVSDSANNRVCIYSPDGLPVFQFQGNEDINSEQLKLPRGIALDKKGCLIVADSGNSRIQIFSKYSGGHKFIKKIGSWGPSPGQFKGIEGICCLQNDQNNEDILLAVADRENNRIQLFG